MTKTYPLYFERVRVDWERRARRGAAILIAAAHIALIAWLLLIRPPIALMAPPMVVIELDALANATTALDRRRRGEVPGTKGTVSPRSNPASHPRSREVRADDAARPPVTDGHLSGGNDAQTSSALAAANDGVNAIRGTPGGGSGAGSGGRFVPPRVVRHWTPGYPRDAWLGHVEGDVDVVVTISASDELLDAHVDRSSGNAALDDAAVAAVRHYAFKAATKGGEPVTAQAIVDVQWRITPGVTVDPQYIQLPIDARERDVEQKLMSIQHLKSLVPDISPGH